MAKYRRSWIARRQPRMANMLKSLVFLDETCLKTNMVRSDGWAPCGERLIVHAPAGRWKNQAFIARLRHDSLVAPWVIDNPMNRRICEIYFQTQLLKKLKRGDVVIMDNLSSYKSPLIAEMLQDHGVRLRFLPPYSPDLNPIEMTFSKLKALIRKEAVRSYTALWKAVEHVCNLFSEEECLNFFQAAGYRTD